MMNYGHRIPLLAASGTGFAIASSNGYGILTFVSDNSKDVYGTLPSVISPSERTSYIYNGETYYSNPYSSYFLARAENKDGDKDRSEFYFNGKRVKFLPKTTFRYVWNETLRHKNLLREEASNKLSEFNKEQLKLEKDQTNKINNLTNDLENNKNKLLNDEKELNQSKNLVEKLTKENTVKLQEISKLTIELEKRLEELKEVQETQNKEEVKLIGLENNLSDENNNLEVEIKVLESKIKKISEIKNYKLSLENASENLIKIEEELKILEKEYLDEKNMLSLENDKLLKLKEKFDFAYKCYEDLKAKLDKLKNIAPYESEAPGKKQIPGEDQNPGKEQGPVKDQNPGKPVDVTPGELNNKPELQHPSVNQNGLHTLPNTGESQTGMATVAGLVGLAVAIRLRKKAKGN